MTDNEKPFITINDVEYDVDTLSDEQKTLVNHVSDLDRKIGSARFSLDQLSVSREAFFNMLTQSLETPEETDS